ncbi:MAG: hypothetical protein JO061_20790 [Acidobacteriaceae bacterium]|nr:hypothetical protein [Acidobacteriaceae bacterium]
MARSRSRRSKISPPFRSLASPHVAYNSLTDLTLDIGRITSSYNTMAVDISGKGNNYDG